MEERNRFQILEDADESVTNGSARFISANKEAMEKCLPQSRKGKKHQHAKHIKVHAADERANETSSQQVH